MNTRRQIRLSARSFTIARILFFAFTAIASLQTTFAQHIPQPPYPPSKKISGIQWHWDTHQTAAIGSDLWPATWGPDDNLYLAWGDGGGFGGSDSDGRVSMGFARIEGGPERFRGININGGKNPEHTASFPKKGKTSGLIFDHGFLYADINLQDGAWPNVTHVIAWSTNNAADWTQCDWFFPKGLGNFQPARFLSFGRDNTGVPARLTNYLYLYGVKQVPQRASSNSLFLARVPTDKVRDAHAYQYFGGVDTSGKPSWQINFSQAQPIFSDANGIGLGGIGYNPHLGIFLLTTFHVGPGQLGLFESPEPWGPWHTIAYYEDWGQMGKEGEGLTCEFPQKWMAADGRNMWAIFSVYGQGAKTGIKAHDRFNLIKVTLENPK